MNKPEILAPTGTVESVIAALNGGCDAIYIGGKSFNARAYADNPSDDMLKEIILMCHLRGVKVFVTINTLYKEKEINDVLKFVSEIYSYGAYGVIVQDIGLAGIIKENFPDIMISGSTQMTIHNKEGVKLLSELGYGRIVLARELNESEITDICKHKGNVEIEGFIHGALCVCYSGRCLMSSFIGGRSGNRGRCAQPCRMNYSLIKNGNTIYKGYLLSPRDISTIEIIDRVTRSGLDSLKIEGRMKSPEYVYQVVSMYRKYIDTKYGKVDEKDLKNLTQIFNRGGSSTQGYFTNYSGKNMMSTDTPKSSGVEIGIVQNYNPKTKKCTIKLFDNVYPGDGIEIWSREHSGTGINKSASKGDEITVNVTGKIRKGDRVFKSYDKNLNDSLKKTYSKLTRKRKVNIELYVKKETHSKLVFSDYNIEVTGDVSEKAQNKPMTEEDIIKRIKKTGETPFEFNILKSEIDSNIYIPVSALNNLRRSACEVLEDYLTNNLKRDNIDVSYNTPCNKKADSAAITVLVRTEEQFKAAMDSDADIIYCDILNPQYADIAKAKNKKFYYALPNISRDSYEKYIKELDTTACDGYIIRSYGVVYTQKEVIADYTLNIMNTASREKIREIYNCKRVCISTELNLSELKSVADNESEIVVYGRLPLMTTHQCPAGLYDGNKKSGKFCSCKNSEDIYTIKDRKNIEFPVIRDCKNCIAYIYNSLPIHTLDNFGDILKTGAGYCRIELTTEDYKQSLNIINSYVHIENINIENSTRGHYYRGVV